VELTASDLARRFPWAPSNLSLVWWLDNSDYDFEILTDHDLHFAGLDCLKPSHGDYSARIPNPCSMRSMVRGWLV